MNNAWLLEEGQRNSLLSLYYVWFPSFEWFPNALALGNAFLWRCSAVLPPELRDLLFHQVCSLEVWVLQGKLIYKQAKIQTLCLDHPADWLSSRHRSSTGLPQQWVKLTGFKLLTTVTKVRGMSGVNGKWAVFPLMHIQAKAHLFLFIQVSAPKPYAAHPSSSEFPAVHPHAWHTLCLQFLLATSASFLPPQYFCDPRRTDPFWRAIGALVVPKAAVPPQWDGAPWCYLHWLGAGTWARPCTDTFRSQVFQQISLTLLYLRKFVSP